jgi:hypothetical protein
LRARSYHDKVTTGMAVSLVHGLDWIETNARRLTTPFLVLMGRQDVLVGATGPAWLAQHAASSDKTFDFVDGCQ